jgi:hypothetical protein
MKNLYLSLSRTFSKLGRFRIVGALLCLFVVYVPSSVVAQTDDPTVDPRLDAIRQAVETTHNHTKYVRADARTLGRRITDEQYTPEAFMVDYRELQVQFQKLTGTFDWLAKLVSQIDHPSVKNAVAEMDAGLKIIAEAFVPVQEQIDSGTIERATIEQMTRILDSAIGEWDSELKRNRYRLRGVVK